MSTLAAEIVQAPVITEAKKRNDQLVLTGWKLQALSSAADSMLKSATNLEEEMKKETKYWNHILAVKEKGWAVSRMPGDRSTLGVRFGFLESPPDFREKSMAALRRDSDGGIKLDLGKEFPGNKTLRARVIQRNKTVAVSGEDSDKMEDDSVESAILNARNSIFDAELFSELLRESRTLTRQGVRWSNSRITIPLDAETTLALELVNPFSPYHTPQYQNHKYDKLPQLSLILLRILLSHSHSIHYRQRTALPPVIGDKKRTRVLPVLLTPLLCHLTHSNMRYEVSNRLTKMTRILNNAGIASEVRPSRSKLSLHRLLQLKEIKDSQDFAFSLLANLTSTNETTVPFHIRLPRIGQDTTTASQESNLSILIRTHVVGSEYKLLVDNNMVNESAKALYLETTFSSQDEVIDQAISSVQSCLVKALVAQSNGTLRTIARETKELYHEAEDGTIQRIDVVLDKDSLQVLHSDPASSDSDIIMILERQWDSGSQMAGLNEGFTHVIGLALTKSHSDSAW